MAKNVSTLTADRTKSGLICLWEQGGGTTAGGNATIIAKGNGDIPTATFVRRQGKLANAQHAMIPVHRGYLVAQGHKKAGNKYSYELFYVQKVNDQDAVPSVVVKKFNSCDFDGKWFKPLAPRYEKMVAALRQKLDDYHCRKPYYAALKETAAKKETAPPAAEESK